MPSPLRVLLWIAEGAVLLYLATVALGLAYRFRMRAIDTYGPLIHEFDPWFNFRATQYLADHGSESFFKWFDHQSWYPLGRPVGTTIYPGMQFTSVYLWKLLGLDAWKNNFGWDIKMSLNDVCAYIPVWMGVLATILTGILAVLSIDNKTKESSNTSSPSSTTNNIFSYLYAHRRTRAAVFTMLIMSIIPAHLMRSIGGGFDNESVAMSAMVLSLVTWLLSISRPSAWMIAPLAGLSYGYMISSWGGYVFVGNLIGAHAGLLVLLGYDGAPLHHAYSIWYVVGVICAAQIPVVGYTPLRSLEQIVPLLVFIGMQGLYACDEYARRVKGLVWENATAVQKKELWSIRFKAVQIASAVGVVVLGMLISIGYFGPLSVRVRGLFVKHTKTGNPLVDSVAEHQPASGEAYWQHLLYAYYLMPVGVIVVWSTGLTEKKRQYTGMQLQKWLLLVYAAVSYYFANRMVRLILLLAPVASALGGIALSWLIEWIITQFIVVAQTAGVLTDGTEKKEADAATADTADADSDDKGKKNKKTKVAKGSTSTTVDEKSIAADDELSLFLSRYHLVLLIPVIRQLQSIYQSPGVRVLRLLIACYLILSAPSMIREFYSTSNLFSERMSNPQVVFQARLNDGRTVMVDDYYKSYIWLKENTPQDSRVLSWWDYGYQISGIANRTTLADGNTWNLEHIALIARILTAPEEKAHKLVRHLADYILVWGGGQGDDLAKSPHIARIGSSVFPDICPGDPLCRSFGFMQGGKPTPSMARSILYNMITNGQQGGKLNPKHFQEVYTSKYGLVRIYKVMNVSKKSKAWLADPANRICDAPGSWYCVGQYPKALEPPPTTHRHLDYDKLQGH